MFFGGCRISDAVYRAGCAFKVVFGVDGDEIDVLIAAQLSGGNEGKRIVLRFSVDPKLT